MCTKKELFFFINEYSLEREEVMYGTLSVMEYDVYDYGMEYDYEELYASYGKVSIVADYIFNDVCKKYEATHYVDPQYVQSFKEEIAEGVSEYLWSEGIEAV